MIRIRRIYEPRETSDGFRILVDRLWPRGIKKENAHLDLWMKEIAPSTLLRKWFNHEPEKWTAFCSKYQTELKGSAALEELFALEKKHKTITLLFSAKDPVHNQAAALKKIMDAL
jgi:uncharacterized protein YeaO (DUF488 family)